MICKSLSPRLHQIFEFEKDQECLDAFQHYFPLTRIAKSIIFCKYSREMPYVDFEDLALKFAHKDIEILDSTKFIRVISNPKLAYTTNGIVISMKLIVIC